MMTYFKLITVIALLLCLAPMPYGYYMLVRIATMIAFGMMAYSYAKEEKREWLGFVLQSFYSSNRFSKFHSEECFGTMLT